MGATGKGSWLTRRADDEVHALPAQEDLAVMYRMNSQSPAIEEAFLRYGIRYQLVGGTREPQREVKERAGLPAGAPLGHGRGLLFEQVVDVPARAIATRASRRSGATRTSANNSMFAAIRPRARARSRASRRRAPQGRPSASSTR